MNFPLTCSGTDIKAIRQNFDLSNPTVAGIIRIKEQRLKILQELNQRQEKELSSLHFNLPEVAEHEFKEKKIAKKRKINTSFPQIHVRRSVRIKNYPSIKYKEDDITDFSRNELARTEIIRPPNDYGPMPGVEIGCHWETRMECSLYGVHRPTVAGIHGGPKGAYSIALSGGYPEDIDEGDSFIYTGAGGRDLKGTAAKPKNLRTAPQTKDQQLEGTNLSLVKSIKSKLPIRVIRGYKSPSNFAPKTGYRYDGLYQVVKYWEDIGKTGYRVYRFKMERMKNQAPPPWKRSKETDPLKQIQTKLQNNYGTEEFKENIILDQKEKMTYFSKNLSFEEEKKLDNEIEIYVKLFCKTGVTEYINALKSYEDETDFIGWDE